jgi:RNase H-like domain found in reverse transcriptase
LIKIPKEKGILKENPAETLRKGRIMTFFSRTLKVAERNYKTIERELLAIVTGINLNIHLINLFERELSIYCDHANVLNMAKLKISKIRHLKRSNILKSVKYKMLYVALSENQVADFSSRTKPCDAKKSKMLGKKQYAYLSNAVLHQGENKNTKCKNYEEERGITKMHFNLME